MPVTTLGRLVDGGERSSRRTWLTIRAAGVFLLAGCGADEYESRLANTSVLYRHLELLDSQLQGEWGHPQGIRLRLPPQFTELPAPPPPPKPVKGAAAPVVIDDRQPQYMNLELPGLRGAFLANLAVLGPNHERIEAPGHVYVLSNHAVGAKSAQFNEEVVRRVCEAAHLPVPAKGSNERSVKTYPTSKAAFVPPVPYEVVALERAVPIQGVETQLTLDLFQQGEIQVAIVWVLPRDVESSERLANRRELCLETLKVSGDRLGGGSGGSAAASSKSSDGESGSAAPATPGDRPATTGF